MAESYSVKARLSAQDSGFTSTLNKALNSVKSFGSQIKSGFAFGILTGVGQAAFNTIKNSVTGLVSEVNSSNASWKTFTKNMQMIGKSDAEIAKVKGELQDFAQKTVYSSSDMATTFAQLEAVGVKNTTSLVKGFGGLAAAAENPQQAMKTLSQQATQMAAKPNVAWQDFKLMLEQTPAGISAVAKEMGMTTAELVTNVQDGKIATDKFFEAIAKVGTNKSFTELATEAKTMSQALDGLKETVGNKLTPAFEVLNQKGISVINGLADKLSGIDADALANKVSNMVAKCSKYFTAFREAFSGVGSEIWSAVKEIGKALFGMEGAFGSVESVEGFKSAMTELANVIKGIAGFCKENAGAIAALIKWLPAIVLGIKGFKIASAVAPGVSAFAKGIANLAGKGIGGIASKLFGISKSQKTVGSASMSSGAQMLGAAKSYALMGVAVLAIALGFALLAQSAIALSNAGGVAIAVMAGLVVALAALGVGMMFMLKSLSSTSSNATQGALAMLALGAAVVLVGVGFALMAQSAIALANAGGAAIAVMAGMVVVLAALMVIAAVMGTALTSAAVGLLAFGAAMLMVGAGALMASAGLALIAQSLPLICEYGLQGSIAILALGSALVIFAAGAVMAGTAAVILGAGLATAAIGIAACAVAVLALGAGFITLGAGVLLAAAGLALIALHIATIAEYGKQGAAAIALLGAGLLAFAAGATVAGAACVVLGAGLAVVAAGLTLVAGAVLIAAAGVLTLSAGCIVLSAGLLLVFAGLTAVSAVLPVASAGALLLAAAFTVLVAMTTVLAAVLVVLNASLILIGASALVASAGVIAYAAGMTAAAAGTLVMAAALKGVNSQMKTIASNAKDAESSLKSMQSSIKAVESGLNALGSKVKSAMQKVVSAFDDTASKAETSGKKVGTAFTKGLQSGLNQAPAVAAQVVAAVCTTLSTGESSAYSSGAYISRGFANGMLSCLGIIRSAASQMAAAADKAVRAKAKINSPSKVATEAGEFYGDGWVNGILSRAKEAWAAAERLVSIPQVATPDLAMAYSGELSADYDYYRSADYTIEVPLTVDGKEFARATAVYTQDELNKRQTRNDRKRGKI